MSRWYESAKDVARRAGLDPSSLDLEGTGSEGAVTKGDVEEFLAGERDQTPTQHALILYLVLEGLENDQIVEAVTDVHPDSEIAPGWISWAVGKERRSESAWWVAHREELGRAWPGRFKGTPEPEEDAA